MTQLFGIYVGEVVDTTDPEQRFRVRARVSGVHHPDTPIDGIDFAEVMFPGAVSSLGGAGDFRPYAVGDWVIVQFLAGMAAQPVVMGAFTAPVGGIPAALAPCLCDGVTAGTELLQLAGELALQHRLGDDGDQLSIDGLHD